MSIFNNLLPNGEGTLSADSVHQAREALKRQVAGERINIQPDTIIGPGWMLEQYADAIDDLCADPVIQGVTSGLTARLSEIDFPFIDDNIVPLTSQRLRNMRTDAVTFGPSNEATFSTPPPGCCRSCGCKKGLSNGLCPKCADVEKLMAECLDETGKVDLSGHVGQREEITLEDLSRIRQYGIYMDEESSNPIPFHPRWPSRTAADEYVGYLVVPSCFPLEDYIFPFRTLQEEGVLSKAIDLRAFRFQRQEYYTVQDVDFDTQTITATRNS